MRFFCFLFCLFWPQASEPGDYVPKPLERPPFEPLPAFGSRISGHQLFDKNYIQGRYRTSCLDCHNLDESIYSRRQKPGPPLNHSFYRSVFKREGLTSITEAIQDCQWKFQGIRDLKSAENLAAFLRSRSHPVEAEDYAYPEKPEDLPRHVQGDTTRGQILYANSCAWCHLARMDMPNLYENPLSREYLIHKVRHQLPTYRRTDLHKSPDVLLHSGATPPMMPEFNTERLDDQDLVDIVDYLASRQATD